MYDLAIIGGGPAGYVAAERAGAAGLSVVLFEKRELGGVCLNEGCVPTKTLLYSAKMYDHAQGGKKYGITAENSAVTAKFRELNIPYLYLGDYTEQSPLGKAEWVVAIGEIVGCRAYAEQLFSDIVARYNAIKESITMAKKPKIMFNLPYQDVWYMPSDDSYIVQLVEDAGGEYIYDNESQGSVGISLEEAVELVSKADIWLNPGQCWSLDELRATAPLFANMDIVKRGDVYNNNRRRGEGGGSDFWESAIVRPDVVLSDIVSIMQRGDDMYYHHKLK